MEPVLPLLCSWPKRSLSPLFRLVALCRRRLSSIYTAYKELFLYNQYIYRLIVRCNPSILNLNLFLALIFRLHRLLYKSFKFLKRIMGVNGQIFNARLQCYSTTTARSAHLGAEFSRLESSFHTGSSNCLSRFHGKTKLDNVTKCFHLVSKESIH